MRLVFDPRNAFKAHAMAHILEQAGIKTHITGDFLGASRGQTPADDQTRVWVINDEDEQKAREIIAEYDPPAPSTKKPYRERKLLNLNKSFIAFFLGVFFVVFFTLQKNGYKLSEIIEFMTHVK